MKEADEIRISKLTVSREGMLSHCISQGKPKDVFLKSRKGGERALPRATKGTWEEIHISRCLGVEEAPLLTQNVREKRAC